MASGSGSGGGINGRRSSEIATILFSSAISTAVFFNYMYMRTKYKIKLETQMDE
jgi:hypothetical protein